MRNRDGFVPGTLVHSISGVQPICDIQIGDLVLSHAQDPAKDSARDYKRVTRTFCFEEQPIIQFCWHRHDGKGGGKFDHAFSTPNPLVWSHPQGWVAIARVPYSTAGSEEWLGRNLVMADGSVSERYEINSVYQTRKKEVAYVRCDGWASGNYVDLSAAPYRFLDEAEFEHEQEREDQDSDEWQNFKSTVYHLEVEGWNTFFIGHTGLLVCGVGTQLGNVPINLIDRN